MTPHNRNHIGTYQSYTGFAALDVDQGLASRKREHRPLEGTQHGMTADGVRRMVIGKKPIAASAHGIGQCLRMLAEEAATLNLRHTLLAIEKALETVASETNETNPAPRMH
jgi:hypothetical protein